MLHKAIDIKFLKGTALEVTFQSGEVKQYDVAALFVKYPQLKALKERRLFLSGKLMGQYGIVWTDELDLETETVYEDGTLSGTVDLPGNMIAANAVTKAREKAGMSQADLAEASGILQSDISKLERGAANPTVRKLKILSDAMGCELKISIE